MKVYVDELPSCCEDCVCHNGVSGRCKLLHRTTFDIPPRDCPLQSLAEYDKQVRKQVCEEIRDLAGNYLKKPWCDYCGEIYEDIVLTENDLTEILDQIQGENNVKD